MSGRAKLLASVARTIRDYRAGEIPEPTPEHVDRWIRQFDSPVQIPILREVDHVLKESYYSREAVERGLDSLLTLDDLVGSDPPSFWRQASVFRRQGHGESQRDLVAVLDARLARQWGFSSAERGDIGGSFVYLDDGIFSGERVSQDLEEWIEGSAPSTAIIHLIMLVCHRLGKYWVEQRVGNCAERHGKTIAIKFWCRRTIENRKFLSKDSGVLWPKEAPADAAVLKFRERPGVGEIVWRPPGGQTDVFSSESARSLLEREFVIAGARLVAKAQSPNPLMRPLGYSRFGFGFGSMTVTFRNCPNNAPLALWWGDPTMPPAHPLHWYPLLPRKIHPGETSGR